MKPKIIYSASVLALFFISTFTSCKKDNEPTPPPTISGFSPTSGVASSSAGTAVIITGTNFSTTLSANVINFNGVAATVSAATTTQLTTTVPVNATTGKITVTVNGLTVTSAIDFEVLVDIPRNGLVAFYPFSGNANDVSGNNLNGTPTNGPILSTDRFGKTNQAYAFDGVNDYIDMGNPTPLQLSGKLTVSAWAYGTPTSLSGNPLVTKFSYPSSGVGQTIGYYTSLNSGLFACYSGGGLQRAYTTKIETNTLPLANTWFHIVLIIDNQNWKYYRNGSMIYTGGVTTYLGTGNPSNGNILVDGSVGNFIVGALFSGSTFYCNGKIDDVAVYNRALSDTEVTQLYQQTITKY